MSKEDTKHLVFVIHKHKATSLHYDFRLQIGEVMPSWAVPKGPTLDPTKKRLAMQVDDHSMEYRTFEGLLPEGEYGAGPVMIWDEGEYLPEVEVEKGIRKTIDDKDDGNRVMEEGMEKGELKFRLLGKKLKGSFALVKTKGFGPKNSWLLIKHKDEFVQENYDANDYDISAKTNLTLQQIENEGSKK